MTFILTKSKDKKKLSKVLEYANDIGYKLEIYEDYEELEDSGLFKAMEEGKKDGQSDMDIHTHIQNLRNGNKAK